MDFGRQNTQNPADIDSLKRGLSVIVKPLLSSKNPDSRQIFDQIKAKLGADNIDDLMVIHAIDTAILELSKIDPNKDKDFLIEMQKQVDLIVNWSLIKIKSGDGNEIGATTENNTTLDTFGSGGDVIVLKDFKMK